MTCPLCAANAGEYDLRKLCCTARQIDGGSRATMRRLFAQAAYRGHAEHEVRAAISELRRGRRADNGDPSR